MRGAAEVVTGMRNTREEMTERDRLNAVGRTKSKNDLIYGLVKAKFQAEKAAAVAAGAAKPSTPYDVIFQSRYRKHRVQVTAPADRLDPSTGILIRARPLAAVFDDGIYRIPRRVAPLDAEFMLERLRQHPAYGVGRDFWEQSDAMDEGKIKATADSVALLTSNPDVRQAVLEVLEAADFNLDDRIPAAPEPRQRVVTPRAEAQPSRPVLAPSDLAPLVPPVLKAAAEPPLATPPAEWEPPPPLPKKSHRKK